MSTTSARTVPNSSPSSSSSSSSSDFQPRVLKHGVDSYSAVTITDSVLVADGRTAPPKVHEFEKNLWHSLGDWRRKGHKGVWMKVSPARSSLIPPAVRCGFQFHHARSDYLMMTAWLSPSTPNKLPPGPVHFIGVAGFVMNSKDEVLSIQEKSGPSAKMKDFWKLPGGLVDPFENISDAVVRELKEETGIDCEFEKIASVQEIHHMSQQAGPARSGMSDLYMICVLRPVDEDQKIVPCEDEIANCRWMPATELLSSRFYSKKGTVFRESFHRAYAVAKGEVPGLEVQSLDLGFAPVKNNVYVAATHDGKKDISSRL